MTDFIASRIDDLTNAIASLKSTPKARLVMQDPDEAKRRLFGAQALAASYDVADRLLAALSGSGDFDAYQLKHAYQRIAAWADMRNGAGSVTEIASVIANAADSASDRDIRSAAARLHDAIATDEEFLPVNAVQSDLAECGRFLANAIAPLPMGD